jgi:hypothetical protein
VKGIRSLLTLGSGLKLQETKAFDSGNVVLLYTLDDRKEIGGKKSLKGKACSLNFYSLTPMAVYS